MKSLGKTLKGKLKSERLSSLARDRRWKRGSISDLSARKRDSEIKERAVGMTSQQIWKQQCESNERGMRGEGFRDKSRLTSLSPFFFLVWTDRDSTSLSNWSTCMFNVSIVFWDKRGGEGQIGSELKQKKTKKHYLELSWHKCILTI